RLDDRAVREASRSIGESSRAVRQPHATRIARATVVRPVRPGLRRVDPPRRRAGTVTRTAARAGTRTPGPGVPVPDVGHRLAGVSAAAPVAATAVTARVELRRLGKHRRLGDRGVGRLLEIGGHLRGLLVRLPALLLLLHRFGHDLDGFERIALRPRPRHLVLPGERNRLRHRVLEALRRVRLSRNYLGRQLRVLRRCLAIPGQLIAVRSRRFTRVALPRTAQSRHGTRDSLVHPFVRGFQIRVNCRYAANGTRVVVLLRPRSQRLVRNTHVVGVRYARDFDELNIPVSRVCDRSLRQAFGTFISPPSPDDIVQQFTEEATLFGGNLLKVTDELFTLVRRDMLDQIPVLLLLREGSEALNLRSASFIDHVDPPSAMGPVLGTRFQPSPLRAAVQQQEYTYSLTACSLQVLQPRRA